MPRTTLPRIHTHEVLMQLSDVDVINVVIRCASCGVAFGFA